MRFSIIIPLYNRPDEIKELLESLLKQTYGLNKDLDTKVKATDFEVVVIEDGSEIDSQEIVESLNDRLNIKYLKKENEGPAQARNFGVKHSKGEWLLFLDSDCVVPEGWLEAIARGVEDNEIDMFGGPDRASDDFTPIQKAISYSMTSLFTTGGIRGSKHSAEKFHPRSFNMGISRKKFEEVEGFAKMRFGEDVDLSIRLMQSGARSALLLDAWVYHKRRVDFKKFFRQVKASGGARIALSRKHKGTLKLVHLLPAAFLCFVVLSFAGSVFCPYAMIPLGVWAALILVDSTIQTGGVELGVLSVVASLVQLTGYGWGFILAMLGRGNKVNKNFYK